MRFLHQCKPNRMLHKSWSGVESAISFFWMTDYFSPMERFQNKKWSKTLYVLFRWNVCNSTVHILPFHFLFYKWENQKCPKNLTPFVSIFLSVKRKFYVRQCWLSSGQNKIRLTKNDMWHTREFFLSCTPRRVVDFLENQPVIGQLGWQWYPRASEIKPYVWGFGMFLSS